MMKKLVFATLLALSGMVGTAHAEFISELREAAAGGGETAESAQTILDSLSEQQIKKLETFEKSYNRARKNGDERGMNSYKSRADKYLQSAIQEAVAGNTTGLTALQNAFATTGTLGVAGATTLAAATVGGLAALFGRGGGNSGSSNSTSSTSATSGTN